MSEKNFLIPMDEGITRLFELPKLGLPVKQNEISMREYSQQEIEANIAYHKFYAERCKKLYDADLTRLVMMVSDNTKQYMLSVETKDAYCVNGFKVFLSNLMDYHVQKRIGWEMVYEKQTGKSFTVKS